MIALLAVLAVGADLTRVFPREAEVQSEPGLSRVPLTSDVLSACQPDLSDLRLFDLAGREVPYVIDSGDSHDVRDSVQLKIGKVNREETPRHDNPSVYRESIDTSAPPDGSWTLIFDTPLKEMIRTIVVTAVSKSGVATELVKGTLFRLPLMQSERLSIPIHVSGAERLVIVLDGAADGYVQPTITAVRRTVYGGTDFLDVPLTRVDEEHAGKRSIVRYTRPPGIVPSSIELTSSTDLYSRPVRVIDEGQAIADRMLATGRIFHIHGYLEVVEAELSLRPARGDRLRIEIDDGDSPPLQQVAVSARVRQPVIVFNATAPKYTLRFGGGRARRPVYDVSGLIAADTNGAAQLLTAKVARLLPPHDAEGFDAKPALAFAMHAGGKVDVSLFTHRALVSVAPSADGLSAVFLPASIATLARADLGDVRIVDKRSQQWPYLVGPTPLLERRDLTITAATDKRVTRYALADTFAPMRIDRVELDIPSAYMDREASLVAKDMSDREQVLATPRLVRRADDPSGTLVTIAFAPALVKALTLVVQDKDDAPLAITSASARHVSQKLFVAAGRGSYVLLVGNADVTRPNYELEAARDTVLAVTADEAILSELSKNPDYRAASTLAAGEHGLQIVLWIIIALAVLILGGVTLRLAKS